MRRKRDGCAFAKTNPIRVIAGRLITGGPQPRWNPFAETARTSTLSANAGDLRIDPKCRLGQHLIIDEPVARINSELTDLTGNKVILFNLGLPNYFTFIDSIL
jgi:hypothetical protein